MMQKLIERDLAEALALAVELSNWRAYCAPELRSPLPPDSYLLFSLQEQYLSNWLIDILCWLRVQKDVLEGHCDIRDPAIARLATLADRDAEKVFLTEDNRGELAPAFLSLTQRIVALHDRVARLQQQLENGKGDPGPAPQFPSTLHPQPSMA